MINSNQFLQRLKSFNKHSDWEYIENGIRHSWDDEAALKEIEETTALYADDEEITKPRSYPKLYKFPGLAYFFELSEAQSVVEDDSLTDNWVYDRNTQVLIVNLSRGHHESFLNCLYSAYTGKETQYQRRDREEAAGNYIIEGYGYCLSSVAMRANKGINIKLSAQEKIVFGKIDFIGI